MSSTDDTPRVSGAPETIWLCYGDLDHDDTHAECANNIDVTWCDCSQGTSDVRYVRADLSAAEIERLGELAQRALDAWDSTVLPRSNDGMMQERMEDLRSCLPPNDIG